MREHADAYRESGGSVQQVNAQQAEVFYNELQDMREWMPDAWDHDAGVVLTRAALNEIFDGEDNIAQVFVAGNEETGLAGALSLADTTGLTDRGGAYVSFLGTTGLEEGAGSALVQAATKWAADRDLPLVGTPTADAMPFWKKMGWHYDPENTGEDVYGLTIAETKAAAR
jgi:GNAT superfamily N-acetyltransferase